VVIAVAAAGCGGEERSAVADQLAALCEEARTDVEALGLPAEKGPQVVAAWADRGRELAAAVGKLEGATPTELEQLGSLRTYLDEHYAGLKLASIVYSQTGNATAYAAAIDRARAFLISAEQLAKRMGAPECAKRPFDDVETPSG
jgi:hypothetical protein